MLTSMDAVLLGTSVVLAVSTIFSTSIQLERQYKTAGRLNASKWFLVIGAFFALTMTALVCAAATKGLGAAISPAEFNSRPALQKLLVAAFPPYFLCNMFVKHAWLTFYYGLTRTRLQRYFIHFMQFTAAGFGISSVLVVTLQCIPLSRVWHHDLNPQAEGGAKCINLLAFFYSNATIMIVNDVVMYMIPVFLIRNIDNLRGQRMGIYALFGVGGLVVIASIFRLIAVNRTATTDNLSSNYALVFLWATVENHVGICAACAGALKQKSVLAYQNVRRSYSGLRSKSWQQSWPTESSATRTQTTEDRALYLRTNSLPETPLDVDMDSKALSMELFEVPSSPERCQPSPR